MSKCKTVNTITEHSVCCTNDVCSKTYKKKKYDKFQRELAIYKLNLPYVPKLVSYDLEKRIITMKRVGRKLGETSRRRRRYLELFYRQCKIRLDRKIRLLHERFHKDTGLYHNDIRYKNTLIDDNGKLYLIDFEYTDEKMLDKDMDGIIFEHKKIIHIYYYCIFWFCIVYFSFKTFKEIVTN